MRRHEIRDEIYIYIFIRNDDTTEAQLIDFEKTFAKLPFIVSFLLFSPGEIQLRQTREKRKNSSGKKKSLRNEIFLRITVVRAHWQADSGN